MRTALAIACVGAALAAPAQAAPPRVDVLVVGKSGETLRERSSVKLRNVTLRAGKRRCRVSRRTPLAALAATRLELGIRDHGSCSKRRARDSGALYVRAVGGVKERGSRAGWVYKVGNRLGSTGAGDPSGPFGSGGLRSGAKVSWYWCRLDRSGRCPRTLATSHERQGSGMKVTVRSYDDRGRGRPEPGATVTFGSTTATTGEDGTAVLSGTGKLVASKAGMVRSFAVEP